MNGEVNGGVNGGVYEIKNSLEKGEKRCVLGFY
jgi:hypothetical protein